jgi:arylsulfatase A-like enzyme
MLPALLLTAGLAWLGCSRPAEPARASGRPPNFVIFLVDMLRPDHLGTYGYPKRTSPNLDRLANRGIVFERAYSAAPSTFPSTVSLLTGLFAAEHGAGERRVDAHTRKITFPADPSAWLPPLFARHGYATVAFHSHPYLRRDVSNIYKAFEEYYDSVADPNGTGLTPEWDPRAVQKMFLDRLYPHVETWLRSHRSRPFLLYLHVIDVHGPYTAPNLLDEDVGVQRAIAAGNLILPKMPGLELYSASDRPNPNKAYLYDGQIHSVDAYLGRLHAELESLGIAADTYLIFTSDHGEGFGERDYWGHGKYVYDDQIHVPLAFLSHAGLRAHSGRLSQHVNTAGLLLTLAELAGIEVDPTLRERGFAELLREAPLPNRWRYESRSGGTRDAQRRALTIDGRYKLITERETGSREFYDLRDDPHEERKLDPASVEPGVRARLDALLARRTEIDATLRSARAETRELDDASVHALETLGYLR